MSRRRPRRPRLAVLSHSAVEPTHARKWALVAAAGWDVLLLVPRRWPEAGRWQRGKTGRRGPLRVESVGGLFAGRVARWTPLGLGPRLRAFAPDLVHAEEEPYGMSGWAAARWARDAGVPFTFFTWENIHRRFPWPQRRMLRSVLEGAAGALAGNADAVRVLRRRRFRRPVEVVPQYGIDPRAFRPLGPARCRRALGWRGDVRWVGYVGRFLPEKGIDLLATAAARLPDGVHVAFVGSGPEEARLRRLAARLLPGRHRFVAPLPRTRMATVMSALDVLVLPSRTRPGWIEQFGRVIPEAHACGTWAVGSDSGEIPRVLGDARFVFREGDAAALAGRLRPLLGRRPPAALRRRAVARFSDTAVAASTVAWLRARLDSPPRPL